MRVDFENETAARRTRTAHSVAVHGAATAELAREKRTRAT